MDIQRGLDSVGHSTEHSGRGSRARRLSWLAVLVSGVIAYVAVLRAMIFTEDLVYFPTLLLIGSITVPVSTLMFAAASRQPIRNATSLIVFTAIVGGLVGTLAAGVLEYDTLRSLSGPSMILVGIIEEAAKLVVPVLVYLFARRSDARVGVIVGIAAGMGFATMETMGYGFEVLLTARSIAAVDQTLLLRALISPANHIAWTGMAAAMLWRIRSARNRAAAIGAFVLTYVVAVAMHSAGDASTSIPVHIALAALGYGALLIFVHRAHRVVKRPESLIEPPTDSAI